MGEAGGGGGGVFSQRRACQWRQVARYGGPQCSQGACHWRLGAARNRGAVTDRITVGRSTVAWACRCGLLNLSTSENCVLPSGVGFAETTRRRLRSKGSRVQQVLLGWEVCVIAFSRRALGKSFCVLDSRRFISQ